MAIVPKTDLTPAWATQACMHLHEAASLLAANGMDILANRLDLHIAKIHERLRIAAAAKPSGEVTGG